MNCEVYVGYSQNCTIGIFAVVTASGEVERLLVSSMARCKHEKIL
jgi:hypothetical protein